MKNLLVTLLALLCTMGATAQNKFLCLKSEKTDSSM